MWPSLVRFLDLAPEGHPHRLRELLDRNGGFTIRLRSGDRVDAGICVATRPSRTLRFDRGEWDDHAVDEWMSAVAAEPVWRSSNIGGWVDPMTGAVCLDVVRVVPTPLAWLARPFARASRQRYVFDLGRCCTVTVR